MEILVIARSDYRFYRAEDLEVGKTYTYQASAPGIGQTTYRFTREGHEGMYGVMIEDTVRELEPWEVI